jgi:RsmE family RNA methyltransferase
MLCGESLKEPPPQYSSANMIVIAAERRLWPARGLPQSPLAVRVGPEGGFAEDERALLLKLPNLVRLSLGPRILRADTAAVAALALVQAVLGDWGSAAS